MFQGKQKNQFNAYGLKKPGDRFIRLILIIVITLLPIMAYFQYTWLGQLSEAETVRTRSNLKISADRFSEDFDGKLTMIYETFQIEAGLNGVKSLPTYLFSRYQEFNNSSNTDSLIEEIYFLTLTGGKETMLFRLDLSNGSGLKSDWPPWLTFIQKALLSGGHDIVMQLMQFTQTPWLEEKQIIITSDAPPLLFDTPKMQDFHLVMIVLNYAFLQKRLLPALVEKHFGGFEDLEFDLAIVHKGDPEKLFYQSDPSGVPKDFSNADVRTDLGRWRMRGIFIATAVTNKAQINVQEFTQSVDNAEISLKVIKQDSIEKKEFSRYSISKIPRWELLVRHHSGSLEAAIAATHLRNLLISYGILALLGISIFMVYILSVRAKRLANQQMEFVAGVSHELRTPLSIIRSAGENLADGVGHSRQYGRLIRDEGRRLTELVEQVLTFAGIQNGRQPLIRQKCNINTMILEILGHFDEEFKTAGASVKSDLGENLPEIQCDLNGMSMVIKNIISNALKYTRHIAIIHLTTKFNPHDKVISIGISDNGMGIGSDEIDHIFEPFFRSRAAVDAQIRGTGLGLSLARKIVELHEGTISVSSKPAEGCSFEIILPVRESDA